MLTPRENFLQAIRKGGAPDRLVNQYEALSILKTDPILDHVRGPRYRGMQPTRDGWGVLYIWPEDQFAAMPWHMGDEQVVRDITCWRTFTAAPDLERCADPALWEEARRWADGIDRTQTLVTGFMPYGVFELLHSMMGFEDTLVNFLMEPEAMAELCAYIGEYRLAYAKLLVERLRPDAILSHDDWGTKNTMFISPALWRTFLKPQYEKLYRYLKSEGVLVIHHADSYLEPIVEDMAEIGIDVWQGVLPQNDIPAIQDRLDGGMALMGGIESAEVDRADSTEEEIRSEVRRACETYGPGGQFIPCLTYGGPSVMHPHALPLIRDEIGRYNLEHYGIAGL